MSDLQPLVIAARAADQVIRDLDMVAHNPIQGDAMHKVMGFVNARAVLQARSPVRYGFLDSHRASWLPFLRTRPPVGDFLGPSGPGRLA